MSRIKRGGAGGSGIGVLALLLAGVLLSGCGGYSGAPDAEPGDGSSPPAGTPGPTPDTPSADAALIDGKSQYVAQCQSCHGASGGGGIGPDLRSTSSCPSCSSQATLSQRIASTMPSGSPGSCSGDCASNVAAFILNGFSTTGVPTSTDPGTGTGTGTDPLPGTNPGTGGCTPAPAPAPQPEPTPPVQATCAVDFTYNSSWNTGFVANITVRNFSGQKINGWKVSWTFPNDQKVTNFWNTKLSQSGHSIQADPADYNASIDNNASIDFGMQGEHGGINELPSDVRLEAPGCVVDYGASAAASNANMSAAATAPATTDGGCSEPPPVETGGACTAPAAPRLQRLLTRWEYQRTVEDLTGITDNTDAFIANIPLEARVAGYDNNARVALVTDRHVDEYLAAAKAIAERAVGERRSALLGCDPNSDKTACTRSFVQAFGRRAFRRNLSSTEVDQYAALMGDSLTGGDFDTGMKLIITGLLVSPNFLYRSEAGLKSGSYYRLEGYETAAALSYLLWGSGPDDALLDDAYSNRLNTADGRETAARRLMADPRARKQMAHFAAEWLGTDYLLGSFKDPQIFPNLTDPVRRSMVDELSYFVNHVVFDSSTHRFDELLNANYVFVNGPLRNYYGLPGSTSETAFQQQTITDGQRGGVLGLGAVLASHAHSNESSPIKRGVFVRERLLCHDLPDPPANVDTTPPGLDPSKTTRERFAAHTADPACSSCHGFIDGIGFGMERYDGAGAYRMTENGTTVDDSGSVKGPEGFSDTSVAAFHGVKDLQALVAATASARDCMVTQYYRYARGYVEDQEYDMCTLDHLQTSFADAQGDLQGMLINLTRDESFVTRRAEQGTP